ncbi:MAG TPA: tRNA (5-methylaminomethyl-2-thiouridine)(34)-methyltransferase MnmD [Permianibacter sp.]|nr:tRNA (5-methylaminomethyl-2-thiouridine)(34)-methyltransferase MnmD [Permianibacter sp.]
MAGLATVDYAELDWEADGTPRSRQFNDIYFSRDGGLAESRYVYLQGNGLPARWAGHFQHHNAFHLFEAGFGTGLNFLLTCQAFLENVNHADKRLRYVAVERFPLRKSDLARALGHFPSLATEANALLAQYPPGLRGWHSLQFADRRIELLLQFGDIADTLPALRQTDWQFDAWYLDGFAPARNEAMWAETLWPAIATLSRAGATAATFSAAGAVRRGLQSAGFSVQKMPGFGRKRDMTVARLETPTTPSSHSPTRSSIRHVTVLGAGIAGAATARVLAERGLHVSVVDAQPSAGGTLRHHAVALASPRWSRDHNLRSQFQLLGFLQLQRWLDSGLLSNSKHHTTSDNSENSALVQHRHVLTLLADEESAREKKVLAELGLLGEHADYLNAAEASAIAGISLTHTGVLHRLALAIDPAALCQALLAHPRISQRFGVQLTQFAGTAEHCELQLHDGSRHTTDALIIAGGADCRTLLAPLPLRPVRGQSTELPATPRSNALQLPLRFGGYLAPAVNGWHTLGASYDGGEYDPTLRETSQVGNLDTLAWAAPELAAAWRDAPLRGDVGHRLVCPDRSPLIGTHPLQPRVWLHVGHGSHALMTACIGAELLCAQLLAEPTSVPPALQRAVSPARFRHHLPAN